MNPVWCVAAVFRKKEEAKKILDVYFSKISLCFVHTHGNGVRRARFRLSMARYKNFVIKKNCRLRHTSLVAL